MKGPDVAVDSTSRRPGGSRWPSVTTGLGAVGVVFMFMVAGSADWGPPGTPAYSTYQTLNRLVLIPAMMLVVGVAASGWRARRRLGAFGWLAWLTALLGSLLIVAGNVGEFWLFTARSYSDSARNTSWAMFLLGGMLLVVASILVAIPPRPDVSPKPQPVPPQ